MMIRPDIESLTQLGASLFSIYASFTFTFPMADDTTSHQESGKCSRALVTIN